MAKETNTKTTWILDPAHSELGFKVKHMMITNVSGTFEKIDATVQTNGQDFGTASVNLTADLQSISTGNTDRDNHLKSGDFFDVEKFPSLKFVSSKVEKKDAENFLLYGDLTIRDITKPVRLDAAFGGIGKDPWGNEKAGFTLSGKIDRTDFNLSWNAALEMGGVLVGEEVKLYAEVELVKQV